jgi:HAD superfamily hydrolase (TIGR01549 family)
VSGNTPVALNGRTIRCILFDCGETLWTFPGQDIWQSMQNSANQRAITLLHDYIDQKDFPPEDDDTLALELRTILHRHIYQFTREHPYDEPDFTHVTLETLAQLGFPQQSKEVGVAIFEALRVSSSQARTLFPDTLTTLASLQERGFILGIVTNRSWGGQPFVEDMRTLGLLAFFDAACMAVSADLGIRKPNPAIFMHALNALQVAPTEAVMVGDSLGADVVGANQLNIFTAWKPSPRMIAEAKATLAPNEPYLIDKHLIPYAHQRSADYGRPLSSETAKPGIIIEHLSELLDIFLEVGEQ